MSSYHCPSLYQCAFFFVNIYYDDKISACLVENRLDTKILSASFSSGTRMYMVNLTDPQHISVIKGDTKRA